MPIESTALHSFHLKDTWEELVGAHYVDEPVWVERTSRAERAGGCNEPRLDPAAGADDDETRPPSRTDRESCSWDCHESGIFAKRDLGMRKLVDNWRRYTLDVMPMIIAEQVTVGRAPSSPVTGGDVEGEVRNSTGTVDLRPGWATADMAYVEY